MAGLSIFYYMKQNEITYYDHLSIMIITHKGILKRLYVPFRVICSTSTNSLRPGVHVFVDGVYLDKEHRIVYQINGTVIPYNFFTIQIFY